jgi:hypothetical protein
LGDEDVQGHFLEHDHDEDLPLRGGQFLVDRTPTLQSRF